MKMFAGAALLLAFSATVVAAQPGPMMGGGHGPMGMGGGMMQGMCPVSMSQRTEGALAYMKTELKISAAQTAAWDAFAAAYREHAGQRGSMPMMRDGMMGPGAGPAKPLPERMSQHLAMMEQRIAHMKKLQPAVAQLYGALSADQKKTADEVVPMFLMCRMM
jgi:hypothetical protein